MVDPLRLGPRKTMKGPGMEYAFTAEGYSHRAIASLDGVLVGELAWKSSTGEILIVWTHPEYLRQGVATRLFRYAQSLAGIPAPRHSRNRTTAGKAWSASL